MKISIDLTPEEAKEILDKKHWEDFVQRWIADDRAADMLPEERCREKLSKLIRNPNAKTEAEWDEMAKRNDAYLEGLAEGQRYASYNYHKPAASDHPGLDGEDD